MIGANRSIGVAMAGCGARTHAPSQVEYGICTCPPPHVGDMLYVFASQGDDEVTLCLEAGDGKELWRNKYAAQAVTIEKRCGGLAAMLDVGACLVALPSTSELIAFKPVESRYEELRARQGPRNADVCAAGDRRKPNLRDGPTHGGDVDGRIGAF